MADKQYGNASTKNERDFKGSGGGGSRPQSGAASTKNERDYGHDPEVDEMMAELEAALAADQQKRAAGMGATVQASRQMKEEEMLNKVEKASREATQRMEAMPQASYPTPVQPGAQGPQGSPTGAAMTQNEAAMMGGPGPQAMAPPVKAQPMPAGPPPAQPMPQMPPPQPMAMAPGPPPAQPMPQMPPAQPLPPAMPSPQPMAMTPEQWAMMQQDVYG
jgi:hypothetical protein